MSDDIDHLIHRLEEALELQETTERKIASTPVVAYCLNCDIIAVDTHFPDGCLDHSTIHSDGYEHAGIQEVIATLRYLNTDSDRGGTDV